MAKFAPGKRFAESPSFGPQGTFGARRASAAGATAAAPPPTIAQNIAADIAKGKELLGAEFKEGALGRIDAGRGADISRVIEGRRAALGGFTSEESQAMREKATQGIERGTQTALRRLRGVQGGAGVRGATASAQAGRQLSAGQAAKANLERDLLIKGTEQKGKALGAFEQSVTGAETTEQQRELFNIQQQQAEIFGRQAAGLGFAQLGTVERTGKEAASAARAAGGGGGGKK